MITIHPVTFISVYDPTSFKDWIFILRGHKKVFDGMTSFQMYLNPIFFASSLEALTAPDGKGPQYVFLALCCCLELTSCCFGLMFGSLSSLYLLPNLDTCICSGISIDVSLHFAAD